MGFSFGYMSLQIVEIGDILSTIRLFGNIPLQFDGSPILAIFYVCDD